jgi:hypothetical protein
MEIQSPLRAAKGVRTAKPLMHGANGPRKLSLRVSVAVIVALSAGLWLLIIALIRLI